MTILLLALAVVASPAQASTAPRRKTDPDYPIETSRKEAERTLQLYADCLVQRRLMQPKIAQFLRTAPGTSDFSSRANGLVDASCAPKAVDGYKMRINPALMQTSLYSALYRQRFAQGPVDLANRAPIEVAGEFDSPAAEVPAQYVQLRTLGDCTVRRNPAAARDVVLSRSGSDTERAAFAALVPDVQQCVSRGSTLRFSKTVLRGVVAEALYKLSLAPATPAPAAQGNAG